MLTRKPRIDTFGIELEIGTSGTLSFDGDDSYCGDCDDYECSCEHSADGAAALRGFAKRSLVSDPGYRHEYHCDCRSCDYDRTDPFFAVQADCTVAVELVSRVARAGNDDDVILTAVDTPQALAEFYDVIGKKPNGTDPWGNHIHVGSRVNHRTGQTFHRTTTDCAAELLKETVASYMTPFAAMAAGGCSQMRTYNGIARKGNWANLVSLRSDTIEFRLWNTPALPERIGFHVAMSVAMTEWAFDKVLRAPSDVDWRSWRSITERLIPADRRVLADELAACWHPNFSLIDGGEALMRSFIEADDYTVATTA